MNRNDIRRLAGIRENSPIDPYNDPEQDRKDAEFSARVAEEKRQTAEMTKLFQSAGVPVHHVSVDMDPAMGYTEYRVELDDFEITMADLIKLARAGGIKPETVISGSSGDFLTMTTRVPHQKDVTPGV